MTTQSTQPLTDEELERIRDLADDDICTVRDMRLILGELERLHSWDGLMELLDEKWPEDIFPTREDDTARDPGPRIVSLLRWVDRLRRELAEITTARDFLARSLEEQMDITERTSQSLENTWAERDRLRAENNVQAQQLTALRKVLFEDAASSHSHRLARAANVLRLDQNEEGQANATA